MVRGYEMPKEDSSGGEVRAEGRHVAAKSDRGVVRREPSAGAVRVARPSCGSELFR